MDLQLVGYFDKHLTKINLLEYYVDPALIPTEYLHNDLLLKISLFSGKRTISQNSLLFGYAYPIIIRFLKETSGEDFSKDYVHSHNLQEIQGLEFKEKKLFGETVWTLEKGKSSNWTKKEFSLAYDKLQNWWAEKGCVIPDIISLLARTEIEVLYDDSVMPYGTFKGKLIKDIPDDYLLELYNNPKRYCSESLKDYIENAFENL